MNEQITMADNGDEAARPDDGLRVEYWAVDRLVPYARNARTHSEAQIAGSMRAFGHRRSRTLAAARKLRLSEVPVFVVHSLCDMERRQLVCANNRIALNVGWNAEMLGLELKDLSVLGAELSLLGFGNKELAAALASDVGDALTDENEVPEPGEKSVSRLDYIWCLGQHRVACVDSTDRRHDFDWPDK